MNEYSSDKKCPCCSRHCNMDALQCDRGRQYKETGVIPERKREKGSGGDGAHRHGGEHHHGHRKHRTHD